VAVAFALRSTYHTTLVQATPGQLVFGRDMVLNVQHLTVWTAIKAPKQQIMHKNNQIENFKTNSSPLPSRRFSHARKQ
jgi:hypothetical protein